MSWPLLSSCCQVVYILDQVRALEQEMRRRLEEQGLPDIKPNIMVVTRLIPQVRRLALRGSEVQNQRGHVLAAGKMGEVLGAAHVGLFVEGGGRWPSLAVGCRSPVATQSA